MFRHIDLIKLDHPYLQKINDYYPENTLDDFLNKKQVLNCNETPEQMVTRMTCQLLMALRYLSSTHNLVHMDVQPKNILIRMNKDEVPDFVLGNYHKTVTIGSRYNESISYTSFMAPEISRKDYVCNWTADVYGLGITIKIVMKAFCLNEHPDLSAAVSMMTLRTPGLRGNATLRLLSPSCPYFERVMQSQHPAAVAHVRHLALEEKIARRTALQTASVFEQEVPKYHTGLAMTGMKLKEVPIRDDDPPSAKRFILGDLLEWIVDHPPITELPECK